MLMHALAASCEELRARTGNPPLHNLKNSLIIQEENSKKNHKRVVSLYVIKNHVNLHKL